MAKNFYNINKGLSLAQIAQPSDVVNGDIWFDSSTQKLMQMVGGVAAPIAGAASAAGGTGDDLNNLNANASFFEDFSQTLGVSNVLNVSAGFSQAGQYIGLTPAQNSYFRLNYDATKTCSVGGGGNLSVTLSANPAFTVVAGCVVIVGNQARRIVTVNSQTSFVLANAFTAGSFPVSTPCTVSECAHTVDLNNYAGDTANPGVAASAAFPAAFNAIMVDYNDDATAYQPTFSVSPNVAYDASNDLTNWTGIASRTVNETDTIGMATLPSSGTNLYVRFFANKTSGSGFVNLLDFKVYWQFVSQTTAGGVVLGQASGMLDASTTPVNAAVSLVNGKTRIVFSNFTYNPGVNPTGANGQLMGWLNGQKVERQNTGTGATEAYFKEIDSKTVELDKDYTGQAVSFEFIKWTAITDTGNQNTGNVTSLLALAGVDGFQNFVAAPGTLTAVNAAPSTGQFFSTITNRAPMTDIQNDLRGSFGIERILFQNAYRLPNEYGPNGEPVYGIVGDKYGQFRLVGFGWQINYGQGNTVGQIQMSTLNGDYVEVTGFASGEIALLMSHGSSTVSWLSAIDAGTFNSGELWSTNPAGDSALGSGRGYANLQPMDSKQNNSLFSGGSGVPPTHTIRFKNNGSTQSGIYGVDIINSGFNIRCTPGVAYIGGQKVAVNDTVGFSSTGQNMNTYTDPWDNGATVGAGRGGRGVLYAKSDGKYYRAFTPAGNGTIGGTLDRANEEVIRSYYPREFGTGYNTDFGAAARQFNPSGGLVDRLFTLDDNSTNMYAQSAWVGSDSSTLPEGVSSYTGGNGNYIVFQFTGTGLDIEFATTNSSKAVNIYVDGQIASSATGITSTNVRKIVAGLPYQTHVVRIINAANGLTTPPISRFIVYGPKKPPVPSNAVELAEWYLPATNATSAAGQDTVSQGFIRRTPSREWVFNGTGWAALASNFGSNVAGVQASTSTVNDYVEMKWFGDGFDWRFHAGLSASNNIQVSLDGQVFNTSNWGSYASNAAVYGNGSWDSSAGRLNTNANPQAGCGLKATGLPMTYHTLRFTNLNAQQMTVEALDVHMISHSPNKICSEQGQVGPSNALWGQIKDTRALSPLKKADKPKKYSGKCRGWISGLQIDQNNIEKAVSDMILPVFMEQDGLLNIEFDLSTFASAAGNTLLIYILVDGVKVDVDSDFSQDIGGYYVVISGTAQVPLSAGNHVVSLVALSNNGTVWTIAGRILRAQEL